MSASLAAHLATRHLSQRHEIIWGEGAACLAVACRRVGVDMPLGEAASLADKPLAGGACQAGMHLAAACLAAASSVQAEAWGRNVLAGAGPSALEGGACQEGSTGAVACLEAACHGEGACRRAGAAWKVAWPPGTAAAASAQPEGPVVAVPCSRLLRIQRWP